MQEFSTPLSVGDKKGNILVWYLPHVMSNRRKVSFKTQPHVMAQKRMLHKIEMWDDLRYLEDILVIKPTSKNWRVSPKHYQAKPGGLKPGTVSMAPAWFTQAHDVSHPKYFMSIPQTSTAGAMS
jgi:hypothetical protein